MTGCGYQYMGKVASRRHRRRGYLQHGWYVPGCPLLVVQESPTIPAPLGRTEEREAADNAGIGVADARDR